MKNRFQSGILSKVNVHHETFKDVIVKLCALVQREAFTQGLLSLGLLQSLSQASLAGLHGEQELEHDKNSHSSRSVLQKFSNLKVVLFKLMLKMNENTSNRIIITLYFSSVLS